MPPLRSSRTLVTALVWISLAAHAQDPAPVEGTAPADGASTSVSITEDFELRYYVLDDRVEGNPDRAVLNYVEQVNRLNASVTHGDVTVEAQVDEVALFANQYYFNDELRYERVLLNDCRLTDDTSCVFNVMGGYSYANPEKLRLRVEKDKATWILGDAYAAFGRGIALNLNRNVDIDIDTSIQGVKAVLRPGAWDFTIVAGQLNRQQVFQDNPNGSNLGNILPDRRHTVVGVRAERFGLGPANIGAHGVIYNFVEDPGFGPAFEEVPTSPDTMIGGATLELTGVGGIDWYAEGDVFGFPSGDLPAVKPKAQGDPGYATYASAAFYPGKTVWLVEGKRYYQTERVNGVLGTEQYEVAVAPTLEYERVIDEDSSATLNSDDIWGGRVTVDWALKPGVFVPYVSGAVYRDLDTASVLHFNVSPETIVHGIVGAELLQDEGALLINGGYRRDERDDAREGADELLHGDVAAKFPMFGGLHGDLNFALEYFQWGTTTEGIPPQTDYVEVESGFTVQYGSAVALTWFTDFSNRAILPSDGNLSEDLYGALELQVKPTSAITMKAFYGAYKAGIRCAGGQCRQLPGFEGARFSFVAAF